MNNNVFLGVYTQQSDCCDVLGQFLPGQKLSPGQGGAWCDHGVDHGHPDGERQQLPPQDLLHEGPRHLPRLLLLHGVWGPAGVRHRHLQQQEDQDEPEEVGGVPEER